MAVFPYSCKNIKPMLTILAIVHGIRRIFQEISGPRPTVYGGISAILLRAQPIFRPWPLRSICMKVRGPIPLRCMSGTMTTGRIQPERPLPLIPNQPRHLAPTVSFVRAAAPLLMPVFAMVVTMYGRISPQGNPISGRIKPIQQISQAFTRLPLPAILDALAVIPFNCR